MDPMVQAQLKDWVLLLVMLMLTIWGLYLATIAIRRRQQNTMQKALLDKFSSAHDFAEFMQSPAGQKYVMSFSEAVTNPRNAILNSFRTGLVLMFLGVGLASSSLSGDQANLWLHTAGNVFLCLGFGFLLSAAVSYFLAKKIGAREKE